jgi:hypothetical protein
MGRGKRLFLAILSATVLATASAAPVTVLALGDVQVTLSCSDGTETDVTVDSATLLELKDAVAAMTLYPAGLSCSLTETPLGLGLPFLNKVALAAPGTSDFAVGGGQYACGIGFINFSVSAHRHENGHVNGSIGETIPNDIPGCLPKGHFRADVECFRAVADDGWGIATFTQVSGYYDALFDPGDTVLFGATDNGNPGGGVPDGWNNTGVGPPLCPEATTFPFGGVVPLLRGNIVVRDNIGP